MRFHKELQSATGRYDIRKLFDDYIQVCVCCLALGKMEDRYENVMKRYGEDRGKIKTVFAKAFALMIEDYSLQLAQGIATDYLGEFYEEIGASNAKSGQFFTPMSLCKIISQITKNPIEDEKNDTVSDPCSGSGRILIEHCMTSPTQRLKTTYHAADVDNRCVNMTLLNMWLHGMKGYVLHQNTLSLETFSAYRVWLPETGLGIQPLIKN